jgi:uncharacterized cupredoxin-like copper-binding protein
METTIAGSRVRARRPLDAFTKLTVAGLVGIGILVPLSGIILSGGQVNLQAFPISVVAWLLAAVVAGRPVGGWRWSPLLGTVLAGLLLIRAAPKLVYGLSNPSDTVVFALHVVWLPIMLIACLAGLAATVQNYRSTAAERRAPRWLPYALTAVAALCSGALLVALIPQPGAAAALSAETLAGLPALKTSQLKFDQAEIRVKKGQTVALRLDNADTAPHSFDLDAFNVHVPMQSGKPSLALFRPTVPGTHTFYCGIPGHREAGMVGTLVVEP